MTGKHAEQVAGTRSPRRKVLLIAVMLVALVGVAGTVAFTTRVRTADNVITFGNLAMRILQTEQRSDGSEQEVPADLEVKAEGGLASRIVRLQNAGGADMYVRARPVIRAEHADGTAAPAEEVAQVTELAMNSAEAPAAWMKGADGWWYYVGADADDPADDILVVAGAGRNAGGQGAAGSGSSASDTTLPLMTSIEFTGDFYSVVGPGGKFVFTVEAQAVQAGNNKSGALKAEGWPTGTSANDLAGEEDA